MNKSKKPGTILGLVAFAIAVVAIALWSRQIDQVAIPENRAFFVAVFLAAAALGITAFVVGTRWFGGLAALVAIFLGSLLPLTVAISRQEVAAEALQVGDIIPHFTSVDQHGQPFDSTSSSSVRTGDPTVSPSCGDGKSFGQSSSSGRCRSSR